MLKKVIACVAAGLIACAHLPVGYAQTPSVVLHIGSCSAIVNGEDREMERAPYIKNNRTMLPLRALANFLECEVAWDGETRTVTLKKQGKTIVFQIDSDRLTVDGQQITLDAPAEIRADLTFVPLRAIASALDGIQVEYEQGLIMVAGQAQLAAVSANAKAYAEKLTDIPFLKDVQQLADKMEISPQRDFFDVDGFDVVALVEDSRVTTSQGEPPAPGASASGGANAGAYGNAIDEKAVAGFEESEKVAESADADFSKTNVQVEWVDEADVIKTDGSYIYKVNRDKLIIAKAEPLSIQSVISVAEENMDSVEMFLDDKTLTIIGNSYTLPTPYVSDSASRTAVPTRSMALTRAVVYDISDKTAPIKIRTVDVEGHYTTARKIGEYLYFVNSTAPNYYWTEARTPVIDLPVIIDEGVEISIKPESIGCFPGTVNSIMNVVGFSVWDTSMPANVTTYAGNNNNTVYCSGDNLYVTCPEYGDNSTRVYKLALGNGKAVFAGKGSVPGFLINQFSMDEYQEHLRVATTLRNNTNSLFVLNDSLKIVGQINDIAPGEIIYSTRFLGSKGYMVTFKTTDPLFAMDLSDPQNPQILGALKIPGYSQYLHPYDENHLIGFGMDTTENKGNVMTEGMKLALFDVTDMTQPKELFVEIIGERGTSSELLYNHRALLFSKEKELLAFPATVYENGALKLQGGLVYTINLEKGFSKRGEIVHASGEQRLKSGMYEWNAAVVERMLYIKDTLYAASNEFITAHDINTLVESGSIEIGSK